jgi:acetylornithine deacetylase/succinyl-diaminopimelate desuccinylase-like protein
MRQIGLPNVSIDDAPNVVGVIPGRSAKVLVFVSTLDDLATEPEQELVFAAVAQEKTGMAGMRKLYAQYKAKATAFVDLVGDGRRIAFGAIGIHWWKVVATGPGPIGGGTPAIGISGERGGQRGFPDEWADIPGYLTVHGAHGTRASIPMPASGLHTTTDCRSPRH